MPRIRWTNPSVLRFAGDRDPIVAIEEEAREQVLAALDAGWRGPPFNPIGLADLRGIPVEANADVRDARTVPSGNSVRIQFNPTQPRERVRFSVAHEVAHTLFDDVAHAVRHRSGGEATADDWQLEMLCNIAAAEFVMPLGSLGPVDKVKPIEELMVDRRRFDVSAEAYVLRVVKVAAEPVVSVFAAAVGDDPARYRIDYSVPSRGWNSGHPPAELPSQTMVGECTAVGHTLRGSEMWPELGLVDIECVGIPAYPGRMRPRLACIVRHRDTTTLLKRPRLNYLQGNVLEPIGDGERLVLMLVNDKARRWGGGLAKAAATQFPGAETSFADWLSATPKGARLGQVHFAEVERGLSLASIVGQDGFGGSEKPRIRYSALARGLARVADVAVGRGASVHMGRIGTGAAGGDWQIVEQIVDETLVSREIPTTVYDLPPRRLTLGADLLV